MIELRATEYTASSTEMKINAVPTCTCKGALTSLCNNEMFHLITCLAFPTLTTVLPVYITINGTDIPVMTKNGNTLMSDQIRSRHKYCLKYGTNPSHFITEQCLPLSQATASATTLTTPSTT